MDQNFIGWFGFFSFKFWLIFGLLFMMASLDLESGLADHDNYHEYCRLLGRFRVNYQVFLF